jgi:hypothetical protein
MTDLAVFVSGVRLVRRIDFTYHVGVSDDAARDIDDLVTARVLIAALQDELTRVQRGSASVPHRLDLRCQRLFGKKSERFSPDQLELASAGGRTSRVPTPSQSRRTRANGPAPGVGAASRHPAAGLPEADTICECGHRKTRIAEAA